MISRNSRTGADAPIPSEEGPAAGLTLASPEVRAALRGATNAHSEADRVTGGLLAVLDALEDELGHNVEPRAWSLFHAALSSVKCLERTLKDAEEHCCFIDMRVLGS